MTREGHWLAAVFACGEGAIPSHRSAAHLWGLTRSSPARTEVTTPRRPGQQRPGLRTHTSTTLLERDITTREAIPCTSVARTLLDLAEVLSLHALDRAVHESVALASSTAKR